jgi:hypothetical protein
MHRTRAGQRLQAARRGSATVEFALVVPLLVSVLMFSMFLTEVVRAKLKLQEASRYVAWEMTSYVLSDYGTANHDQAFDVARQASVAEAGERYKDFDSVEPEGKFGFMLRARPARVEIRNQTVAGIDLSRVFPGGPGATGPEAGAALGQALNFFLDHFRFNTRGQVEVEVTSTLESLLLPRRFLQNEDRGFFNVDNWGGKDLSNLPVRNRYTLIANGWQLPDGGDAMMKSKRAGMHDGGNTNHGLHEQVGRMTFLGVDNYLDQVGLDQLGGVFNLVLPDFLGPFVVSHNYRYSETETRGCNKDRHGAFPGLNNLDEYPGLDDPGQRCFDTAPFRDTHAYEQSLYRDIFNARGEYFMGCKNAQADMPNVRSGDPHPKDKNKQKVSCE